MAVADVTTATFTEEVLRSDRPVIVDFYADWCWPCRAVSPLLEALSEEWEGEVRFAKVDVDRNPELSSAFHIVSIPTVLRFEAARPTTRSVGAVPRRVIERKLGLRRGGWEPDVPGEGGVLARMWRRWRAR
ncbi:MAG: thioredoxin [Actinobacteria bacterium]|nr:thioredoxin [Actinomycetota bacterium]